VVAVVGILAAGIGAVAIPPLTVVKIVVSRAPFLDLAQSWPDTWDTITWQLRLPRIVLAGFVGGALAMSGATYQGLFRNPLADPYLIGVASGAGLGATIVLLTDVPSHFSGLSLLPVAAFAGAVIAVAIAYTVARSSEGMPLTTLILAGVAVASLAGAATSLLMIRSDPDLRPVLNWLLGGFASAQWNQSAFIAPYLAVGAVIMLAYGRILNVLQLDEEHAQQLGVNPGRTKVVLIAAASLTTAAAVSFSGLIGFVGLIAPHAVRLVWGPDYRALLPMAAVVGAGFLILADLVARTVVSPSELPVGVVTAFCGAPFFLYLLRRRRAGM
jgi:iron complex transport system permease protein